MGKAGRWSLSPVYDVVYAHNPIGDWTNAHQMTINCKSDEFALEDLPKLGEIADLKPRQTDEILREVEAGAERWSDFAEDSDVPHELAKGAHAGF